MPIENGQYVAPTWVDGQRPPINAAELQAICDTLASIPEIYAAEYKLIGEYTTAGSYSFTVPDDITDIIAFVIGAGGSGAAAVAPYSSSYPYGYSGATGGASGDLNMVFSSVTPAQKISLVVGAGGAAVSCADTSGKSGASVSGNAGGTSSFNGKTASGGPGGNAIVYAGSNTVLDMTVLSAFGGIQSSCCVCSGYSTFLAEATPYGGISTPWVASARVASAAANYYFRNSSGFLKAAYMGILYFLYKGFPSMFAAGGSGRVLLSSGEVYTQYLQSALTLANGKKSSAAALGTATKGTDPGCGGGAAAGASATSTATSAAGCDGAVYIFGKG